MSFTATAAYRYNRRTPIPFYAPKRGKALKSSGFTASDTHDLCIKDEVLIDTARVSGLDVMDTLNLLTMDVAENTEMGCFKT